LKAVAEAKSREQRAIRATTIFFWFFSCEKEKNEEAIHLFMNLPFTLKNTLLPLF